MKQREHFELQLEQAMAERNYHPDTQEQLWRLVGRQAVSCEALLNMFTIVENDHRCHEMTAQQNSGQLRLPELEL